MDHKIFIDTMIFLHFRPLDELDLQKLLDVDEITLVVPRVTLRELDKHKSSHGVRKVRDRARRTLSELETAITQFEALKGGIKVEHYATYPKEQLETMNLNEAWADDVLVASIIAYREETGVPSVILITQDSGPRLTCHTHGIRTYQLDDALRLPEELDDVERENRELLRQVQQLKNALPRLEAAFVGSGDTPNVAGFTLKPHRAIDEEWLKGSLADIRKSYPKLAAPGTVPKSHPLAGTVNTTMQAMARLDPNAISPEQYEEYNQELQEFYRKAESYLRRLHDLQEPETRTISFTIEIRNVGNAPAEDVDVFLYFPDGFKLYREDDRPEIPEPPQPPTKPMSMAQRLSQSARSIMVPQPRFPDFELPSSFEIEETNSYAVRDHFKRIKHGIPVELPKMCVEFPSLAESKSFNCTYKLRPANLAKAVEGELHFVINVES